MASNSDRDDAAGTLGVGVAKRYRERPGDLVGMIGPFSIYVGFVIGDQGSSSTRFTVGFPPGSWDDYRITVRPGSLRWKRRRSEYFYTGDGDFDRRLVVRWRRTKRNPVTHDWLSLFLTAERRKALLDLQDQLSVGLETGRPAGQGTAVVQDGVIRREYQRERDARSVLVYTTSGRADRETIIETVRAMVTCAEVLIKEH